LASMALAGCDVRDSVPVRSRTLVRVTTARMQARQISATLTGEVRARVQSDQSFRISGRVIERLVDVGAHVNAGDLLARLDPAEQQADLDAANATVVAARLQLRVATSTLDRQKTLLVNGFTTRAAFDQAQAAVDVAAASLDSAIAQLGTARDTLTYTELRSSAAGIITARTLEIGQISQAASPAFTLAQDGARDAVFDVYESFLFGVPDDRSIDLTLVSDPSVTAHGRIHEVSPTIDPKTATTRVKVAIDNPPTGMTLGAAVAGTAHWRSPDRIVLPWSALTALRGRPAVWLVDPAAKIVTLREIGVDVYESGVIVVASGLQTGEKIVIDGGKLLSPGQSVTYNGDEAP